MNPRKITIWTLLQLLRCAFGVTFCSGIAHILFAYMYHMFTYLFVGIGMMALGYYGCKFVVSIIDNLEYDWAMSEYYRERDGGKPMSKYSRQLLFKKL